MRGAPLRFAATVLGGWTIGRIFALWPATIPSLPLPLLGSPALAASTDAGHWPGPFKRAALAYAGLSAPSANHVLVSVPVPAAVQFHSAEQSARRDGGTSAGPSASILAIGAPAPVAEPLARRVGATPSRWAADAWLVLRPGGGNSLAFGQLGAAQGGARVTYALDRGRRLALSTRLSAPLRGKGAEAGVGLDIRPTRLPVHLLVEERLGLDGGGARPAVTVIAGTSARLPGRARLDAYVQGGAVWRRGGFADGAALAMRPVLERGATRIEIGGGVWGAAQRRAARLDVGPSIALTGPAGATAVRMQLEYRFRVAGRARPASGPALTLGGSF